MFLIGALVDHWGFCLYRRESVSKIFKLFGIVGSICLFVLSHSVYSSLKQPDSNHQYTLHNTMYLCESMNATGKNSTIYLLNPGQSLEFSGLMLPSVKQYLQQKAYWQHWQTSQEGGKDRVITVIDKGTAFSVKQYKTTPTEDFATVTIAFSSGPYAGRSVLYSEHELTLNQLS